VLMLKAVKHLSMNPTLLEVLQNANAIEILIRILDEQATGPHSAVSSNDWLPVTEHILTPSPRKYQITFSKRVIISVV
jgi:hypothetical protein